MSEYCETENELCKKFAFRIYSDMQKYIDNNREECEQWIWEEEQKINKKDTKEKK